MFKTETHSHTYPASSCSHLTPQELVTLYHEAGYTTLFIADHFSKHHFDKLGEDRTFLQKTEVLYNAYLEAKAIGERYGMYILFSPEMSIEGNHFLLYGADLEFLQLREDIFTLPLSEVRRIALARGITMVQAHPYRNGKCTPQPEYIDGAEVVNGNPRAENFNEKAMAMARQYHLPMTAGSDAHRLEDIGATAVLTEQPITSIEDYLTHLKAGTLKIMKNEEIL